MDTTYIFKKFKELRKKRKYSLSELAIKSGVSKSYLSKIENEMNVPSLVIMRKIAEAMGVDSTYFMTDDAAPADIQITRKVDRPMIPFGLGLEKYYQAPLAQTIPGRTMDPYVIEVPHNDETTYSNEGDRFYIILEGKVEASVAGKRYVFESGDSVYIGEGTSHTSKSISKKPAKVLMISSVFRRIRYAPPFGNSISLPKTRQKKK